MEGFFRRSDALRNVKITPDYTEMAAGSVLIECGKTRVICTASVQEGVPPFKKGSGSGWLTAEYAMLPGSTSRRKERDGIKKDGRGVEIQRLIGRSLRAACDLTRLGERTVYIDCDVIQADGGTRTASITGAFVALVLACDRLIKQGLIVDSPVIRQVAAVSVGIVNNVPTLDIEYAQDSGAQVDMNVVMTRGAGGELEFAELQGAGEGRSFTKQELNKLIGLAEKGIKQLMKAQLRACGAHADIIGRKPRLVVATHNFGKLREIRAILGSRYDIVSQSEAGSDVEAEENGETFEQNALVKAETLMRLTGCAVLADDSGLVVDALNGRPGVRSARYSGVHGDDEANINKLLSEISGLPGRLSARFECAAALCRPGRAPIVAHGVCEGHLARERRGTNGFGYDPIFLCDELGDLSFGEADAAQKQAVSHRARAIAALMEQLDSNDKS